MRAAQDDSTASGADERTRDIFNGEFAYARFTRRDALATARRLAARDARRMARQERCDEDEVERAAARAAAAVMGGHEEMACAADGENARTEAEGDGFRIVGDFDGIEELPSATQGSLSEPVLDDDDDDDFGTDSFPDDEFEPPTAADLGEAADATQRPHSSLETELTAALASSTSRSFEALCRAHLDAFAADAHTCGLAPA